MKITEVRIFPSGPNRDRLVAFASVTLDNCFVIKDISIIQAEGKYILGMPGKRRKIICMTCGRKVSPKKYCGECGTVMNFKYGSEAEYQHSHKDLAHPITKECREMIEEAVMKAYWDLVAGKA